MQSTERSLQSYIEASQRRESGLWVSPDISLVQSVTLAPGEEARARVQLTKDSIPQGITLEEIRLLRETPRSRYAQVFLEVENIGEDLYQFFLNNGLDILKSDDAGDLQPEVALVNYARRPNHIRAGGGLFRIYSSNGKHLTGDELLHSPIRVDGKSIDIDTVRKNQTGLPVALRLMLDPLTRKWIPPSTENIDLDPDSVQQRTQITELLVCTPETDAIIPYLVYSKEQLTMPEGYYGIVRNFGYARLNGKETHRSISTHGNSQLLDPNRDWRIIFELRGRTTLAEVANFIDIDIFSIAA